MPKYLMCHWHSHSKAIIGRRTRTGPGCGISVVDQFLPSEMRGMFSDENGSTPLLRCWKEIGRQFQNVAETG